MSNPTGLYSRIKTWGTADTILGADLNAEFDNILSNFNPEMLAGYSQNATEMQTQTYPGAIGSESLATSLAGELARLRYMISAISGTTYWYTTPAATLAQLNSIIGAAAFGNRINSGTTSGTTGSVIPSFLVAAGSGTTATLKATSVALSYQIAGVTYTIAADTTLGFTLGGTGSTYNATVTDLTLPQAGTQGTNVIGENGSQITVSSMGASMSAVSGQLVGLKTTAGEYLLGRVQSATQITNCMRGFFFDSTGALVSRGTISNTDILQLMGTSWIFASTTGTLSALYNREPKAGGVAPATPASGDYWYDTSTNLWKTYTGTAWTASNSTLIGIALTDSANCVATRSFEFFGNYSDLSNIEIFADSQNSGTIVRSRLPGAQVSVYGTFLNFAADYVRWDFSTNLDTGSQVASTLYYFYLDTNGRSWISKVAPNDRRNDLRGYYHPGKPWRCFGYGWSNSATLVDNVESFYRGDDASPVSNITTASNVIIPYNIVQREQIITLTGAAGAFTQVLPPPAQLKGKYLTYIRTDNTLANVVTLQSWGTAIANPVGTISTSSNPTVMTGLTGATGLAAGQLVTGPGIPPNTLIVSTVGTTACTISAAATLTLTAATFSFANAAGYSGTVGQQTAYIGYGINGQFTTTLCTQFESVTITSDGYAYFIKERNIPSVWANAGPIGADATHIAATTTNATKGTIATDIFWWRRSGQNMEVRMEYRHTAAGTVGSGDYLFGGFPTGTTMDTQRMSVNTTVYGGGNGFLFNGGLGTVLYSNSSGGATGQGAGSVIPYNTTQVRMFTIETGTSGVIGSGYESVGGANCSIAAEFSVPITNWQS